MFMHSSTGGMKIPEMRGIVIGYEPPIAAVSRTATGAWIVRGGGPRRSYRTKRLAHREQARREKMITDRRRRAAGVKTRQQGGKENDGA